MSRRVGADGRTNCRTAQYHERLMEIPDQIRKLADAAFEQFLANPDHPSLRLHNLKDNDRGSHRKQSRSVAITMQYRAIYVVDEESKTNVWYWVGSHAEYNHFTGRN